MKPWWSRVVLPGLAFVIVCWRVWNHDALLSLVLIVLPLIGVMAIPGEYRRQWKTALMVLLGPALWVLHAWTAMGEGHRLVWWPLLGQLWCASGFGLVLYAVFGQVWRWWRWWSLPAMLIFVIGMLLVALPLTKLYRIQVTPRHIDDIFIPGERFDLTGADGQRLYCRWSSPPSPVGVMVFTHGIGGSFDEFVGVHQVFQREGWAVLDWNLRGHGRSGPAATTYGLREADDLVFVWAEATRRAAGLPVAAYGASMGAAVSLMAAPRLDHCAGLALESSFAELAPLIRPNLPGPLAFSAGLLGRWGLRMDVEAIRPIDALASIRQIPLLLGTAELDRIVPPDHGQRLADAAPWATHIRLAGWGHMDLAYDNRWRDALANLLRQAAQDHGAAAASR